MKLRRLVLENFRRHAKTEIEFPDGVTAIVGRNGAGKSTILEAIGMALYGIQATRTNKDLLRRDDAPVGDPVRVVLDAEVAGQAWTIERALRNKALTPQASLTIDGQVIVPAQAGSNDAVTQEVTHRIGLDREAFFTTVFSGQKELARLANQPPATRKRMILNMLGVDALDAALVQARSRRKQAAERVETLRLDLPNKEAVVAEHDAAVQQFAHAQQQLTVNAKELADAQQRLQVARQAADEQRKHREAHQAATRALELARKDEENARHLLAQLQPQIQACHEATVQLQEMGDALKALDAAKAALDAGREAARASKDHQERAEELAQRRRGAPPRRLTEQQVAAQRNQLTQQQALAETARAEVARLDAELRHIGNQRRRLTNLDGGDCPLCQRPMEGHLPALEKEIAIEQARIESLLGVATAKETTTKLAAQEATHAAHALEQAWHRQEAQGAEHDAAVARLEAWLAEHPAPRDTPDLAALQAAHQAAEARHRAWLQLRAQTAPLAGLQQQEQTARATLDAAQRRHQEATAQCAALAEIEPDGGATQRALEAAEIASRRAEQEHAAATTACATAEVQRDAASRRQEEAMQRHQRLDTARDELEHWELLVGGRGAGLLDRFRAHLVGRIGPAVATEAGRLLARFTAGRYDEVRIDDDYAIFVSDGGVAYEIDRFSGGESDLVHLALRLAVSRLLLERSQGAEIRFLALDEVFGALDEERRDLVLGAMQELGSLYSQVLVVTHQESLREALDHTLLVEETDGIASAVMHND